MKDDTRRTFKYGDPDSRLHAALKTLENFTKQTNGELVPYFQPSGKGVKGLSKIVSLAKDFVASAFSDKLLIENEKERDKAEEEVLNALEDVKRFHPIITQKKSPEAKILAKRAQETISGYNSILESQAKESSSWHKKLLKFLIKRTRLGLSKTHTFKPRALNASETKTPRASKIFSLIDKSPLAIPLSERERDVFRMKAITLMKNHPALFPSVSDLMHSIHESPIYFAVSPRECKDQLSQPSIITLEQTLTPFPGETVVLRGSFKHDPQAPTQTMPLSESFEMTSESIQTGFPYPSQHNGWALSDPFFPPFPFRPENIQPLTTLLEKKEAIAEAFLKKTLLLEKSRNIWRHKIDASRKKKTEFLFLHYSLYKAMLGSCPKTYASKESQEILQNFFDWVEKQNCPLTALSGVQRNLNILYIDEPVQELLEGWLGQSEDSLFLEDPKKRFDAAKKILLDGVARAHLKTDEIEESIAICAFMKLFGRIFGISGANVFLQYFSETLECAPPQLSVFEKALQTAAIVQQEAFIQDLESDSSDFSFIRIKDSLLRDSAIFQKNSTPHPLCKKLERYYISRFVRDSA